MSKSKTQKSLAYSNMIATCVANAAARRTSAQANAEWRKQYAQSLNTDVAGLPELSNNAKGDCYKKSVTDTRWKNPYWQDEEMAERERLAQIEIENKKKKVSIAYSKGPVMYCPNDEDAKCNGRRPKAY